MATISTRVIKCLENRFPHDPISLDTLFQDDLSIDSLGMLEFLMDLEDEFDINIPDRYIKDVISVQDVVTLLTTWNDSVIDNSD